MTKAILRCGDGSTRPLSVTLTPLADGGELAVVSKDEDYTDGISVELDTGETAAYDGDPGYILLPRGGGTGDYALFLFARHNGDMDAVCTGVNMPVYGVKSACGSYLCIVSGMPYDCGFRVRRTDGAFRVSVVISLSDGAPYEDIRAERYPLAPEDADYSGMARRYRQYRIGQTGMRPIKERMLWQPALAYAVKAPLVRVRCGWKPAPAEILHQTLENEPEMHVACDFAQTGELMAEFRRQGIADAAFTLVGWNRRGHDGRWPQAFPVEEALGGEAGLRALLALADGYGYEVTCHTNHTDQYEIADCYRETNTRTDMAGIPQTNAAWSGGQMYDLCPRVGYEQAMTLFPQVRALGFRGIHYVDVLSTVLPRSCHRPEHPVNKGESADYARRMAQESRRVFGGFSSEGGYDYLAPYLDYGLYISFGRAGGALGDVSVPFWELVYHGYVLYNPYTLTVNPTFKDEEAVLRLLEYGGRPSYYFYSAFMRNGRNWMGDLSLDPVCGTAEERRRSTEKVRRGWELYREMMPLTLSTMEDHRQIAAGVFESAYANGKILRVNYNTRRWEIL